MIRRISRELNLLFRVEKIRRTPIIAQNYSRSEDEFLSKTSFLDQETRLKHAQNDHFPLGKRNFLRGIRSGREVEVYVQTREKRKSHQSKPRLR
jgi:hypothetical protein